MAKRDWRLSLEAFARLLAAFHPDREQAGQHYERTRERLASLFRWRGCSDPYVLADETFDRVARRLEEGAEVSSRDPFGYFYGVAGNVLQEHWRDAARRAEPIEALGPQGPVSEQPNDEGPLGLRLECLHECLDELPCENRRLLEQYHRREEGARIRARKDLAAALGLSATALRLRAYRIRASLAGCIEGCEARARNGSPPAS